MPFDHCISAALADQLITAEEAHEYQRIYADELHARMDSMPGGEAAAEAARETFRAIEGAAAEKRRQTFLSVAVRQDIGKRLDTFRSFWNDKPDPYLAATGLYDRLVPNRRGLAVEQQHEFWRGHAQAFLDDAYSTWKRGLTGQRRNRPRLDNIVREAFGETTGDSAAHALAQGWRKASESLRQAFNRFGGHIGHLDDWGLPQGHSTELVRAASLEEWRDFIKPRLDRSRMLDRKTGRPLDDAALDAMLADIYRNIKTRGWATREATAGGGSALANRYADHRVLHFRDADKWLEYQKRFGEGDPINAMLAHIDRVSRDVALMQVMGPNPTSTLRWVQNDLTKRAAEAGTEHRATWAGKRLTEMHVNYTRSNAAPTHPIVADVVGDLHNVLSAAQLGAATVTAVPSDLNLQRVTRGFNGLPEVKMIASYFKQLNPLDDTHRMMAIRAGLGAQHYGEVLGSQGRYVGQLYGKRWSRWINDRVLTVNGLSPWTAAGRSAFGLDLYGHVADQSAKAYDALDAPFRDMLDRYGIGAADWDVLRATPAHVVSGAPYLRPGDIMDRKDIDPSVALDLAGKLADAAQTETEFAVPSAALLARSVFHAQDNPGSVRSVAVASASMYRTFGSVLLMSHGRRVAQLRNSPVKLARYTAGLVVGSMFAGAVAIQAKEFLAGRDPRDMDDWRFWTNALAVGGGLGILGDFIYAGLQGSARTGQGLATILGGPIAGFAADVGTAFIGGDPLGPASRRPSKLKENFPTRLLSFVKRYTPGGNIWYARLVLERYVWDNLQEMIDPGWKRRTHRIENWYRRQFGSEYYWKHGDASPTRAPDFSAAVGGSK